MIKKLLLSFILSVNILNAYESDLIQPKKDQGTIIDIGFNDPTEHNIVIVKEWTLIDALFREIAKEPGYVARELSEEWDCVVDDLGNQNCPEKQETCPKSYLYDSGQSHKFTKTMLKPDYISSYDENGVAQYSCPSDSVEIGTYRGKCKTVTATEESYTKTENWGESHWENLINLMKTAAGKAGGSVKEQDKEFGNLHIKIKEYVLKNMTKPIKVEGFYKSGGEHINFSMNMGNGTRFRFSKRKKSGTDIRKIIVNDNVYSMSRVNPYYFRVTVKGDQTTKTVCEERKKCQKTYYYYTYDCDNLDDTWSGPLKTAGGDCKGSCTGNKCYCNDKTAPYDNCQKPQWLCPFDNTKPCTKIIDPDSANDIIEGDGTFIYENGTSERHDKRLERNRSCIEGMTWNKDEQRCEDEALKRCLKSGYTIDYALNECYGPAKCETNEVYDISLLKCVERIVDERKCKDGMNFDTNKNRCILEPTCVSGKFGPNGKCLTKIDRCFSGLYDEKGNCKFLVNNKHIFGQIQLLANTGSFENGDVPVYSYLTSSEDDVVLEPDQGEYVVSNDSPTGYKIAFTEDAPENYDLGTIYPAGTAAFGDKVTFNFWMKWDGTAVMPGGMPIAFSGYDLWIRPTQTGEIGMGFNTGQGDMVGIMNMAPYANKWIELTAVFTHKDTEQNKLYINGQNIPLKYNIYDDTDKKYRTFNSRSEAENYETTSGHNLRLPSSSRANIEGPIHFNGWEANNRYALNYDIAGLKVYNEGKTYSEIHSNSDGSNLMTLHYDEQINSISTSSLKNKGFLDGTRGLSMEVFHYGSGCGLIKFNPAPDSYEIVTENGSLFNASEYCAQNNVLIGSGDKKSGTILAKWNNPPERIDYLCDDFCFISPRKENLDPIAKTITSEVCPANKKDIFWRYDSSLEKCIADIIKQPFVCEGDDWIYDKANNTCAALMDNWHIASGADSGIWYTSPDKRKMYQAKNAGIILNISDKLYTDDVTFKGDFIVMDGGSNLFDSIDSWANEDSSSSGWKDDDFIGFVFGYDESAKDGFLFTISKSLLDPDRAGGGAKFDGYGNTRVSGASLREGNPMKFPWGLGTSTDGVSLTVLESNLGSKTELSNNTNIYRGWQREQKTPIKIEYKKTGIKIWVNGSLIINHPLTAGQFKDGKIGFLNYSQGGVLYDGFEIYSNELCKDGLLYSEELNECYVPINTKYSNTSKNTYKDNLNTIVYETQAKCPFNGELDKRICSYDVNCNIGTYNKTELYCKDPLNTELCIAPKVQGYSTEYKKDAFENVINLKGTGEISYAYPKLRNKKTGISISSTLLKYSDGSWYKFEGIGENKDILWRDQEIAASGINVKTISSNLYTIKSFAKGDCYNYIGNGDIKNSNECVGEMEIKLPEGLSIIAISDVQSVTNKSTGNNYLNERFVIDDSYEFYRKGFGKLAPIDLTAGEIICSSLPICPDGETLEYDIYDMPRCKSKEFSYYCNDEKTLVEGTSICMNDGYCEEGFINFEGKCILDYTYFSYFCPKDFEIAEEGIDCKGSCGFDDCFCNTETPPSNNCKKEYIPDDAVNTKYVRTIRTHNVEGSLLEEEYGNFKNYNCGTNCKFNIVKITGKGNNICFEKESGSSSCLTVDGCSFSGELKDLYDKSPVPKLKDLNLKDTHTLVLSDYNIPQELQDQSTITCPGTGMSYSTATRYCEGSANFYDWEKKGSSDGDWTVTNSGSKIFQGFNTSSPAFYVSKINYPRNVVLSGRMMVGNDGDDDWAGMVFGYTDTSNYYVVRLSRDPSDSISHNVTHSGNKLSLIKITNGSSSVLATAAHPGWRANRAFNIKVGYLDGKIIVYIDDVKYIDYESPIDLIGGRIGFYNLSQSTVTYDSFHISSSPVCKTDFVWDDASRSCIGTADKEEYPNNKIVSTCKMNGHIGWHSREEGIVSIVSDKDRIKFWDPYKDKDLGFIEFVKDTNEQDNKDGFRPENQQLYNLLSDGFTSIDTIGGDLYFVSGEIITSEKCSDYAKKYDLINFKTETESLKLKQMSGDRYRKMEIFPLCNEGVFSKEIKECMGGVNYPQLCPNGKFSQVSGLTVLTNLGISTTEKGLNIVEPVEIYDSGYYTIEIETTGSLSIALDGETLANINQDEPYARFKLQLEKGFHRLDISASSDSVMGLGISDDSNVKFINSRNWCDNTKPVTCPISGFVNYNNTCERKTSSYCSTGTFNEETKMCSLEPKCVLLNIGEGEKSFRDQEQSVKEEYSANGTNKFICSPLTCKDNSCQLATCPEPSIGTDVVFTAEEKEKYEDGTLCLDQECDAKLAYYELCGIQGSCDLTRPEVISKGVAPDEKCFERYCDEGTYDMESGKCKVLRCPKNTEETSEGKCKRK